MVAKAMTNSSGAKVTTPSMVGKTMIYLTGAMEMTSLTVKKAVTSSLVEQETISSKEARVTTEQSIAAT